MSDIIKSATDRLVHVRMPEILFKSMQAACGKEERNAGGFIRRAVAFMTYDKIIEIDPAVPDRLSFIEQHIVALGGIISWAEKIIDRHKRALAKLQEEKIKAIDG